MSMTRPLFSRTIILAIFLCGIIFFLQGTASSKDESKIDLKIETKPKVLSPGESGTMTLLIVTAKDVKLTNYPQTSIILTGDKDVIFENSSAKLGDGKMPDDVTKNYLAKIDPIEIRFRIADKSRANSVSIVANVSYFYCEAKSGMCFPGKKNFDFKIPLKKRS